MAKFSKTSVEQIRVVVANSEAVLKALRDGLKHRRIIWSPITLLRWLGVKWPAGFPKSWRRQARRRLEELCMQGYLIRRSEAHSVEGFYEVAYMLKEVGIGKTAASDKSVYDPREGGDLLGGKRAVAPGSNC